MGAHLSLFPDKERVCTLKTSRKNEINDKNDSKRKYFKKKKPAKRINDKEERKEKDGETVENTYIHYYI